MWISFLLLLLPPLPPPLLFGGGGLRKYFKSMFSISFGKFTVTNSSHMASVQYFLCSVFVSVLICMLDLFIIYSVSFIHFPVFSQPSPLHTSSYLLFSHPFPVLPSVLPDLLLYLAIVFILTIVFFNSVISTFFL